jgi:hypothetical protein
MTWVSLKPINGSIYADMIIEILNKEGIPHYAKNDWSSAALNTGGTELVNNIVRIFVPENFQERAARLFENIYGE